jgi:PHD/YefM family antitoxin component YafN of YafNO toxin-antitoxin module
MKAQFIRKATNYELIPQDEFKIEEEIYLTEEEFETFINNPLDDYDFIEEHKEKMYTDINDIYHCIAITSRKHKFLILIQSEGYNYARYAAYLHKSQPR